MILNTWTITEKLGCNQQDSKNGSPAPILNLTSYEKYNLYT